MSHVMISFFNDVDVSTDDPRVAAAQYFGTKGFFADFNARLDEPLSEKTAQVWRDGLSKLKAGTLDPMALARAVAEAESSASPRTDRTRGEVLLEAFRALR